MQLVRKNYYLDRTFDPFSFLRNVHENKEILKYIYEFEHSFEKLKRE